MVYYSVVWSVDFILYQFNNCYQKLFIIEFKPLPVRIELGTTELAATHPSKLAPFHRIKEPELYIK